jgi:hypothetical protein
MGLAQQFGTFVNWTMRPYDVCRLSVCQETLSQLEDAIRSCRDKAPLYTYEAERNILEETVNHLTHKLGEPIDNVFG